MAGLPGDDPYEILGVSRQASDEAIAGAYRDLARRFHPDLAGDEATVHMMRINAAFDAIRTKRRRLEFDGVEEWTAGPPAPATAPPEAPARAPAPTDRSTPPAANGGARHEPDPFLHEHLRWRPERDGTGGAGPPPGRPSGSVLDFGRHVGWSIGEIARVDPGYLEWLSQRREGHPYLDEIDATLRRVGYRGDRP